MPPIGINGLPPQGLPTPQSIGSEAAGAAGKILDTANQQPANVPTSNEGLSPAHLATPPVEEAIPSNLMDNAQPPVRVPVQYPDAGAVAPRPETTATPDLGAFAPKPPENTYAPAAAALATPSEQADQRVTPPETDWEAMAKSSKAGTEQPPNTTQESPVQKTYGELSQDNLDQEAASPEAQAVIKGLAQDSSGVFAAVQEISRDPDPSSRNRRLIPWRPLLAKIVDSIPEK